MPLGRRMLLWTCLPFVDQMPFLQARAVQVQWWSVRPLSLRHLLGNLSHFPFIVDMHKEAKDQTVEMI